MVTVTLIDTSARAYKARALKTARWLMKECDKGGFLAPTKQPQSTETQISKRTLEIFIVSDSEVPKNVLAFPADLSFPRPDLAKPALGEIYLNPTYIAAHGENFEYMLIHGFLHLLGYDHIQKNDRMVMEAQEQKLLRALKAQQ